MSIDREAAVWHGWIINIESFNLLCEDRKAVTHEEKRYDPKTGAEIEPEVVIDEESGYYWYGEHVVAPWAICEIVQEWLDKQDIGLNIAPMQWDDGGFSQLIIGSCVDGDRLSSIPEMSQKQVDFMLEHFKVDFDPRISCFMLVG